MIPEEIKVGAQTYRVILDSEIADDDEAGHCRNTRNIIRINPLMPPSQQEETLLHELLHACCFFAGIEDDEKLTEEQFIGRVSPILYTVLKENGMWAPSTENRKGTE